MVDILQDLTRQVGNRSSFPFPGDLHYQGMGESPAVHCPLWLSSPEDKQFPLFKDVILPCLVTTLPSYFFRSHNPQAWLVDTTFHGVLWTANFLITQQCNNHKTWVLMCYNVRTEKVSYKYTKLKGDSCKYRCSMKSAHASCP